MSHDQSNDGHNSYLVQFFFFFQISYLGAFILSGLDFTSDVFAYGIIYGNLDFEKVGSPIANVQTSG